MHTQNTFVPVTPQTSTAPLVVLRRKQVEERTGLSRSTLYHYIKLGNFPKPMALGPRVVGWLESDVNSWITDRVTVRRDDKTD
jgi:prophage regulatory protein